MSYTGIERSLAKTAKLTATDPDILLVADRADFCGLYPMVTRDRQRRGTGYLDPAVFLECFFSNRCGQFFSFCHLILSSIMTTPASCRNKTACSC